MVHRLQFEQWIAIPSEKVFLFFANPGNLPKIMPAHLRAELVRVKLVPPPGASLPSATVTSEEPIAGAGSEIVASFRPIPFLPFRIKWTARIVEFQWNRFFVDVQEKGPFKRFRHGHEIVPETREGVAGTLVRDVIEYEVGFGILGEVAEKTFIAREFSKTFRYRQHTLQKLLGATQKK
ncbi:MAG TPA: SRPBCC family protein [Terriglobales bacterium]|nr:SRPBCC family protein [Terriglobales bacterium]